MGCGTASKGGSGTSPEPSLRAPFWHKSQGVVAPAGLPARGWGMFEKTERGDASRRTLAPLEQAPRDTSSGADCELLRLCDEFRRAHAQWVEYFSSLTDDIMDQAPASAE